MLIYEEHNIILYYKLDVCEMLYQIEDRFHYLLTGDVGLVDFRSMSMGEEVALR